jgi:ribosomal protein S18 acetylase RimI-like enzyme
MHDRMKKNKDFETFTRPPIIQGNPPACSRGTIFMDFVENGPLQYFSYPAVITAMENNLIAYINYCSSLPGTQIEVMPRHITAITGMAQPSLNAIMRVRFTPQQIKQQIASAMEPFQARQIPMLWWLFPGTQPLDLGVALIEQGIQYAGATPGMAIPLAELPACPDITYPHTMTVEEVQDEETLYEWIHTSALSFEEEDNAIDPDYIAFERRLGWGQQRPYRRFLARIAGVAIGTAALFTGTGVVGLYSVGTLPEMRRRGVASALSIAALQATQAQGYQIGVLQASHQGYSMYNRLGFRECCRIHNYIWTPARL